MPVAKRQTLGCLQHSDSYRHLAIHSISWMSFDTRQNTTQNGAKLFVGFQ